MRHRKDDNHDEIARSLEAIGCNVQNTSQVGEGCPDMFVSIHGITVAMEIKQPGEDLRAKQLLWKNKWLGKYAIVHDVDEAIRAINLAVRGVR